MPSLDKCGHDIFTLKSWKITEVTNNMSDGCVPFSWVMSGIQCLYLCVFPTLIVTVSPSVSYCCCLIHNRYTFILMVSVLYGSPLLPVKVRSNK